MTTLPLQWFSTYWVLIRLEEKQKHIFCNYNFNTYSCIRFPKLAKFKSALFFDQLLIKEPLQAFRKHAPPHPSCLQHQLRVGRKAHYSWTNQGRPITTHPIGLPCSHGGGKIVNVSPATPALPGECFPSLGPGKRREINTLSPLPLPSCHV